jgi:hypothetical protein
MNFGLQEHEFKIGGSRAGSLQPYSRVYVIYDKYGAFLT